MSTVTARAELEASADERGAPFVPTLVLAVTAGLGAMFVLIPLAVVLHPSTHLPGPLTQLGDQNQGVKSALYAAAYVVVFPLALIAVPRVAGLFTVRWGAAALGATATMMAVTLPAAVIIARICDALSNGGAAVVLAVACCWWAAAALGIALVLRAPRSRRARVLGLGDPLSILGGTLVIGALLCVTSWRSLDKPILLLGFVAVVMAVVASGRVRLPAVTTRKALVIDLAVVAVLLLAIPDVAIFKARTGIQALLTDSAIKGQENYLLGPANQVLAGGKMLVDTVSQYGVGSIYFLVGWFHLAPIGYGTLGFLDGVLNALVFVAGYCLLRLAGASRLLAAAVIAIGVAALLYHLVYPVGALAEHGPLRFGLPIAAVLAASAATRPSHTRVAYGCALVVVGIASIWSIEAFAYTLVSLAAMAAIWMVTLPAGARLRWLGHQALYLLATCVVAQLIFAGYTLAAAGKLPDWGQYFAYFSAFLFGGVSNLTYGFQRWSPGLAVAALYLGSAISLALIAHRRRELMLTRPTPFVALAGTTAYGIALFSYFDNRSSTYVLLYVAFPALLTAALWLVVAAPLARRHALAFPLALATIVLAASWSSIGGGLSDSALAHLVGHGTSLRTSLHQLWHPPPLDPRSPEGDRMLARYMPGKGRALVVLVDDADLQVELLVRAQRGNVLPIGDPIEDSIVPAARTTILRVAIGKLRPRQRILLNRSGQRLLAYLRVHPTYDPLAQPNPEGEGALLDWALKEISERYALRTIATDSDGFVVAELVPRT